jgi:hypothetical protein
MMVLSDYSPKGCPEQSRCDPRSFFVISSSLNLRFAGRLAGAVAAQRTSVGMNHGWNYQCIKEEQGCRND